MNVFITRNIPLAGLQLLTAAGCTLTVYAEKSNLTREQLIAACRGQDAMLNAGPNKMDSEFLEASRHLKAIALMSVGYDNIDVSAATRLGIPVSNTPGVLSGATADTAFLLMLAVSRKAFYLHKKIARGEWGFFEPTANLGIELTGKTIGIFGLGKIGFEMAERCAGAYHMKIIYHNRNRNAEAEEKLGAVRVSFDELLTQSDVLSVHSVLTPETAGIFDKKVFGRMKSSAIFINTARGTIHNEKDLTEALQEGIIWGAGLDVTNPEPMAPGNPLLDMQNVAVLPHIGSATRETREAMAIIAAQNILAGLRKEPLPNVINPSIYMH